MSRFFLILIIVISIETIKCSEYNCSKLIKPEEFAIHGPNNTKELRYSKCELKNVKYFDKIDPFNLIVDDDYFEMDSMRKDIFSIKFVSSTLRIIPNELFAQASSLKYLDISKCSLRELNLLSFNKAENLLELYMQENELVALEDSYFVHTQKLKLLDISSNRITTINENAFRSLGNLERLSLSYNRLAVLADETFVPLRSLEWLWLDHNQLTLISSYLFSLSQHNLKGAYFNDNQITAISPFAFENSPYLDFLMLNGNNCTGKKFIGHKIRGISVKFEMKECLKEFHRLFPDENPISFKLQQDVNKMKMRNEACNYETKSLMDALKNLES